MGQAILSAALERQAFAASDVVVCEAVHQKRLQIASEFKVHTTENASEAMSEADLVLLSVKPQDIGSVRGNLRSDAVLVSIMAGVRIEALSAEFGHDKIIRVMPNIPVTAKAGMSVWTATAAVLPDQRDFTQRLLSAVGRELYVGDEAKLDMATAVSGSGPAYVFLFIESLIDGGVAVGLSRPEAEEMVLQTVLGSAIYAQESGRSMADLRTMVTSPAGTTAAGLLELERAAMRAAIVECVSAAHARSLELGAS